MNSACVPVAAPASVVATTRPSAVDEYVDQAAPSVPDSNPSVMTGIPADAGVRPATAARREPAGAPGMGVNAASRFCAAAGVLFGAPPASSASTAAFR